MLTVDDIKALDDSAFDDLEFVCVCACWVGKGGDAEENVVNVIYDKGADVVLGFLDEAIIDQGNVWTEAFMETLATGCTIQYAMDVADKAVEENEYSTIYSKRSTDASHRYLLGSATATPL